MSVTAIPPNVASGFSDSAILSPKPIGTRLMRERWTCAAFGRVMKLKALVLELSARGEMYPEDVSSFLKCSPSCTRKYLKELLAAGLIRERGPARSDIFARTAYVPPADPMVVQALASWEPRRPERFERQQLRRTRKCVVPVGHHVHLLDDDLPVQRSRVGVPRRDPMVEAFFGKAPATVTRSTH